MRYAFGRSKLNTDRAPHAGSAMPRQYGASSFVAQSWRNAGAHAGRAYALTQWGVSTGASCRASPMPRVFHALVKMLSVHILT